MEVSAGDFILEPLRTDPHLVAIFEANGEVNAIGRSGLLALAKLIVLLEEGVPARHAARSSWVT